MSKKGIDIVISPPIPRIRPKRTIVLHKAKVVKYDF